MSNNKSQFAAGRSASILPAFFIIVLSLISMLALAGPLLAQDQVSDDEVNEIAKEVYCPVCENTPLDVCETKACADWRELIRTKLGEGETKQQIFDYFSNQYGDRVLAAPPKEGFNLVLWTWPIVALVLGGLLFGRYLRQLKTASEQARPAAAPAGSMENQLASEEEYINRIEKELSNR